MGDETLLQRIRGLDTLTKSESKIASLLEREYRYLAFETIQTLSAKAGVGMATVGRFINRLGYDSFSTFMDGVKKELFARLDTPIEQYAVRKKAGGEIDVDPLTRQIEYSIRNLKEMQARISRDDIDRAARLIAESKGTLYIMGAATSQGLAYFFHMLAMYIKGSVVLLDANPSLLAHRLIDVSENDLLVAITHHRFSAQTMDAARWFNGRGGNIILVSDREFTPISDIATIQLVACSESPAMFNSRCGTLVILETLIAATIPLMEKQVYERFASFEELRAQFGAFASPGVAKPKPASKHEGAEDVSRTGSQEKS